MPNYAKYIIIAVVCAGLFGGGIVLGRFTSKPVDKIKIVEKKVPVTKYISVPATCDDYKDCYTNSIEIFPKMTDNLWMSITASDKCKSTTQSFKLGGTAKPAENILSLNYVHNLRWENKLIMDMGANLSYYRMFIHTAKLSFGLGGGVTITNHSFGFTAGPIFQF